MNINQFLKKVSHDCDTAGIEFIINTIDRVYYDTLCCNGFFESKYPIELTSAHISGEVAVDITYRGKTRGLLAVARGNKTDTEFLSLVAHEYCHMRQYIENSPLWVTDEQFTTFSSWIDCEEVSQDAIESSWKSILLLEADCEQRVISLIKELDLPIDAGVYARLANSYLFFYHWAKKHRRWYNKAPYEIQSILDKMPNTLFIDINRYVEKNIIGNEMIDLFDACL